MKLIRLNLLLFYSILCVTVFFASFFYTGRAKLVSRDTDSRFWTIITKQNKFFEKFEYIYLDRLDRTQAYTIRIIFNKGSESRISNLYLDGKKIDYRENQISGIDSKKEAINGNAREVEIPVSDENGAIIGFKLESSNSAKGKNPYKSAIFHEVVLQPKEKTNEAKHLIYSSIFSSVFSYLILLFFRIQKNDLVNSLLLSYISTATIIFSINSISFRFIYFISSKSLLCMIYLFLTLSLMFVVLYRTRKQRKQRESMAIDNRNNDKVGDRAQRFIAIYLLCTIALLLTSCTFANQPISDDYIVYRNLSLQEIANTFVDTFDSTKALPEYYRPLPTILAQIQRYFFGDDYFLYYTVRVLHNILNLLLLFLIVEALTGHVIPSLVGVVVFCTSTHTAITVHWLSSIFSMTAMTFILAALYCFIRGDSHRKYLLLSMLFTFFALLSKENATMLPFIILGVDIARRGKMVKKRLVFHFSSFFTLLCYFVFRFTIFGGLGGALEGQSFYTLKNLGTMVGRILKLTLIVFVRPNPLSLDMFGYGSALFWVIRTAAVSIPILAVVYLQLHKRKIDLSVELKTALIGFTWFFVMLLPILFPYDFKRLGYVLVPGVSLVFASFTNLTLTNSINKYIRLTILALIGFYISQQAVANFQLAYNELGKGTNRRFCMDHDAYIHWGNLIPEKDRRKWKHNLFNQNRIKSKENVQ